MNTNYLAGGSGHSVGLARSKHVSRPPTSRFSSWILAATASAALLTIPLTTFAATTFTLGWNPVSPISTIVQAVFTENVVITETGTTPSSGTTTVRVNFPAGVGYVSGGAGASGFTCPAAATTTSPVLCTSATSIPALTTVNLPIAFRATTTGNKSFTASISGGGAAATVTSAALASTTIAAPDVSVALFQPRPALMATVMSQVEVRVSNVGSVAKAPINVTLNLPAGVTTPLKFSRIADHWLCRRTAQAVACIYDRDLLAGTNTRLRIPVTPAATGALAAPFTASVVAVTNEFALANNGPVNLTTAAVVANVLPAALPPVVGIPPIYSYPVINPAVIPKYALPLPNLNAAFFKHKADIATVAGTDSYNLTIGQIKTQILPPGFPATNVFVYGDPSLPDTFSFPAHTIEARSTRVGSNTLGLGKPVKVKYADARAAATVHLAPIDHSVHGAMGGEPDMRSVAHLHGAQIINQSSDGFPEAWSSPNGQVGVGTSMAMPPNPTVPYNVNPFDYTNQQEATQLWYHDHTLGITRNNVYAGLAGLYSLRDDNEMAMIAANQIPSGTYEVPLVLQDRMFRLNGDLAYPDIVTTNAGATIGTTAPGMDPSINPEFFGDVMVVNGVSWPYLQVEPRKYRLRILNGSNSRFYTLTFRVGGQNAPFQVIGTEGGFLNAPATATTLTLGPAERYDIIVDFAPYLGRNITVRNTANQPFGRTTACPATSPTGNTGLCAAPVLPTAGLADQIMQFRVNMPLNTAVATATIPALLRTAIPALVTALPPRQVLLGETTDNRGRTTPVLGSFAAGFQNWMMDGISEQPLANTVETWEIFNTTVDAHPIHLHDGAFQVVDRQPFNAQLGLNGRLVHVCYTLVPQQKNAIVCPTPNPVTDAPKAAAATEQGWKDTVISYPAESYIPPIVPGEIVQGYVTRVRMKFEGAGLFAWHCHIMEHEDHDMMRPLLVQ
jgi:spore coat protein A, manganese oxidase